jgi:hypothetical protein
MLSRLYFTGTAEEARNKLIEYIKTKGDSDNPPQPDFVYPGK